jgi:hypothetical protein
MPKVIHEYWWTYGTSKVAHYNLRVEKETAKMFYGKVMSGDFAVANFAIKKEDLNKVTEVRKFSQIEYRVQTDMEDENAARHMAKRLICKHVMKIAEKLIEE